MARTFALLAAVLLLTAADTPISKKNWLKHPRIEAIREKVAAIQKAIDAKELKAESNPACEQPNMDIERDAWRDGKGVIRRYVWEGGSDDSAYKMQLDYDDGGKLLFVYGTAGAVNDSSVELRIYFEDGKEIWRDRKAKGVGYTWAEGFPDKYLHKDPEKALKAPKPCANPL